MTLKEILSTEPKGLCRDCKNYADAKQWSAPCALIDEPISPNYRAWDPRIVCANNGCSFFERNENA